MDDRTQIATMLLAGILANPKLVELSELQEFDVMDSLTDRAFTYANHMLGLGRDAADFEDASVRRIPG